MQRHEETHHETGGPQHELALLACIAAVLAWSVGPLLVRGITAPSIAFTPIRLLLSVPVMTLSAYMSGGRLTVAMIKKCFLPGVLFAASMLSGFMSFQHTSIANATLISALQPVLMLLVAPRLFGERPTVLRICMCVVALGGVSMVVFAAQANSEAGLSGDLYALINLVVWSAYFVVAKRARDAGTHAGSFLAAVFLVATVVLVPVAIIAQADFALVNGNDWWLIAAQVIIPGLIGHTLITWATRYLDITLVSLINLLSPAISMAGAWILYSQSMQVLQVVGAVVMLIAVGVVVRTRNASVQPVAEAITAE